MLYNILIKTKDWFINKLKKKKILKIFIKCREWFINKFNKKILLLERNKILIDNKIIILSVNLFYNFLVKNIFKYYKINFIYEIDELIFYEEHKINSIKLNSIIIDAYINEKNKENSIINKLNRYNKNIPVYIFVKIENLNLLNKIIILFNKNIIKEYILQDIINKRLYEILQNF